jgi:hypothetical protein
MKQRNIKRGVYLAAALAFTAVSFNHLSDIVEAQDVRKPQQAAADRPAPVADLQSAVQQTAAVVEGVVTDVQHEYSDEEGPWTRVTLSNVRAIAGSAPSTVEIRHFGGPLPNGNLLVIAELPVFVLGKEYVVFLRNTTWNVSPVVGDLALRVEKLGEVEVLVNSDGRAVTQVGAAGVEIGAALFEGPQTDGAAPEALADSARTLSAPASKPLDRQRFGASLKSALAAQGLSVGGTFSEKPAGEFRWRGQRAGRSQSERAIAGAPVNLADVNGGSGKPEPDTSQPKNR